MTVLVLVPVSREQATRLVGERSLAGPLQAFTPNERLRSSFGYEPGADEESERAAMLLASVWGLVTYGERIVLVAEVDPARVDTGVEAANGGVSLDALALDEVSSWFCDEFADDAAVAAADSQGASLDDAWELDSVTRLVTEHDLLWHSGDELATEFAGDDGGSASESFPEVGAVTRVHYGDGDDAQDAADRIAEVGLEVALITERLNDKDNEEVGYIVATPTPADRVRELLGLDDDARLEVS